MNIHRVSRSEPIVIGADQECQAGHVVRFVSAVSRKSWINKYDWEYLGAAPAKGKAEDHGTVLGWERRGGASRHVSRFEGGG